MSRIYGNSFSRHSELKPWFHFECTGNIPHHICVSNKGSSPNFASNFQRTSVPREMFRKPEIFLMMSCEIEAN